MKSVLLTVCLAVSILFLAGCGSSSSTGSNALQGRWSGTVTDPNAQPGTSPGTLTFTVSRSAMNGLENISGTETINNGATTNAFTGTVAAGNISGTANGSPWHGTVNINGGQLTGSFYTCVDAGCKVFGLTVPFTLTKQ